MQSKTESFWTIFDKNFNTAGLGEIVFSDKIKQTFIVKKYRGECDLPTDSIMAGDIVGMVEYRDGGVIEGIPSEASEKLSKAWLMRNTPIAPSRELTPGWVRPFDEAEIAKANGRIHFYDLELAKSLRLGFIAGSSLHCHFTFLLDKLGMHLSESWKPADVLSFQENVLRRDLETRVAKKYIDQFGDHYKVLRKRLAGLEAVGFIPKVVTKGGEAFKLSELVLGFEEYDPDRHVGPILPGENITVVEKRTMACLANLIADAQPSETAFMRDVVAEEIKRWKPEWKEAMKWIGEHSPIHESVDKADLDTVTYPIIETFIDVGFFTAYEHSQRVFVKPNVAGFVVLSAVLNNSQ